MINMQKMFSCLLSCTQEKSDVEAAAATPALADAQETVVSPAGQYGSHDLHENDVLKFAVLRSGEE